MIPAEGGGVAPGINEDDAVPRNQAIELIKCRIVPQTRIILNQFPRRNA